MVFASDLLARTIVGALFALLSINLFTDFVHTGHVTGLILLTSESLVVVFTVIRRRTLLVDRSPNARIVTTISLVGPMLLRASTVAGLIPDSLSAALLAAGASLVVVGKLTLGRSFGLVPANRGVVVAGPYGLVRHPIYAGYLIAHVAFLLAHPDWTNIALCVVSDSALVLRALAEERMLADDATYRDYCTRVSWHLVPGVF